MKVQIYTVNGEEFSYDLKPEISFQSHIKNLHENLVHSNDKIKKLIQIQWGNDVDISTHYGIQESTSAQWIETSQDSLISQDNTLYFKLKPLNSYIQAVEKYLLTNNTTSNNISRSNITPNTLETQPNQLLYYLVDKLHIHLALLMFEDKSNLFVSSNIIKRIIKIVFLYPTLNSLNLLVFFLSNCSNNTTLDNNNNNTNSNNTNSNNSSPKLGKKNDSPRSNSVTSKSRLMDSNSTQTESISLFTLVDTCIKELSKDFNCNFYIYMLEDRQQQSTSQITNNSSSIKFEIICQLLKVINNMYRLSPNPVLYISRLHQESVFKRIIEIRERDPKLSQNPQYIVLRSNLMKELHAQRLQQINPEKIQHQILLSDLWAATAPSQPYAGIYSSHWLSIGFRGPNPIEDFKVTGVLALRNLAYFSKNYTIPFQHILMTQTKREDLTSKSSLNISNVVVGFDQPVNEDVTTPPPTTTTTTTKSRSYPLAVACISLTYTLANIFRIGRESSPDASLWDISFCDNNWFDECFITTVNLFESLWHSEAHSYSDFPQVITHARYIIEKVCSDSPKSVQDFKDKLNNILEKKTPIDFEVSSELMARYHQLQPSNTTKRHIHKIFGERIDIDIVPNTEEQDNTNNNNNNINNSSKSLSIDIPNNSSIGDGPISPTNFSYKRLIKFFGERVNSKSVQFAPQPSNVKSYKLKNFFGEGAVILNRDQQQQLSPSQLPSMVNEGDMVEVNEDDENNEDVLVPQIIPMTERSHRLHVFFGEWFDTEQVEYNEKIRISTSPEQTPPTSPTLKSQPEHTRLHKLNKFFGERVNVPITSKSRIIGEGGGGGIFPIDDVEDHNSDNHSTLNSTNNIGAHSNSSGSSNDIARSPEEARSDFKAQKLLGERLDIKKEKEALQFAPQPSHIREYKLHKLFGEMIPTTKTGGGPWKKGSILKVHTSSSKSKRISNSHVVNSSNPMHITSAPTSPRENEIQSPNSTISMSPPPHQVSTSLPSSPRHIDINLPTNPLTSNSFSESNSPQMLLPKPFSTSSDNDDINNNNNNTLPLNSTKIIDDDIVLTSTFGGPGHIKPSNEHILNSPESERGYSVSESLSIPSTFGGGHGGFSFHNNNNNTAYSSGSSNHNLQFNNQEKEKNFVDEEAEMEVEDEQDEKEEEEDENTKAMNKKKRLHVFFGERFDFEDEGYHSRLSGSYSLGNLGTQLSTSLPIQPDTVKFFKLKKFFGKSPDTENDNTNSNSNSNISNNNNEPIKKNLSEEDLQSNNINNNNNTKSKHTSKQLRREFKPQKLLGERIDIKKEKEYSSFKDQPSTIKVDKLIGLFGEKVSFNLKRRDSSPSLPSKSNSGSSSANSSSNSLLNN